MSRLRSKRFIYQKEGYTRPSTLGQRACCASIWAKSVGKYFRERSARLPATRFEEVVAGHVPQDDVPDVTNRILCEWIAST